MEIKINSEARRNFDQKANELLLELRPIERSASKRDRRFAPDLHMEAKITEKDIIGKIKQAVSDHKGNEIGKSFCYQGRHIGLFDINYKKLQDLAQAMLRANSLKNFISMKYLLDVIFEWMEGRYRNATSANMVKFVLENCKNCIKEMEIWIPIAYLCIEDDIKIGKIIFKTFQKNMFEEWMRIVGEKNPDIKEAYIAELKKLQSKHQGTAAATIKLIAEPIRAQEIAVEETEKSLSILRFFSPVNLDPELHSYCQIYGKENIESMKIFLFEKETPLPNIIEELIGKQPIYWSIDKRILLRMSAGPLKILSQLLETEKLTEFQKKILDAVLLYSKSSISKNLQDKLLYTLIALETILLKNSNEPIQQNVGDRIAFFMSDKPKERKRISKNFKDIYTIRSSFIHHGQMREDLEKLRNFMESACFLFNKLIFFSKKFDTTNDFINSIEKIKYS